MHIPEGVLAGTTHGQEVLLAGAAVTALGTAVGLYKMDYHRIPQVAVLSSAFFVASLIQIPLGPTSIHLVLGGLMGLILGWAAFPAILVALLLQAIFFSLGGLTTLGVNTLIMALPAVCCHYLFRRPIRARDEGLVLFVGLLAGATAVLLAGCAAAVCLLAAGKQFEAFAYVVWAVHLPTAAIEGLVTGSVVVLLRKVRPELLDAPPLVSARQEAAHG